MINITALNRFDIDMQTGMRFVIDISNDELERIQKSPEQINFELKLVFSENRPEPIQLKDGLSSFFETKDDIKTLFVDHMVSNLEKRSIFEIVMFLSKYCGWNRIRDQFENYIQTLERS